MVGLALARSGWVVVVEVIFFSLYVFQFACLERGPASGPVGGRSIRHTVRNRERDEGKEREGGREG